MIAQLTGTVAYAGLDDVVIVVRGIGWRVLVAPGLAQECSEAFRAATEITIYTSMVVREDSMTLYGFRDSDERVVFEKLQTVSGIGPRIALAALAVLTPDDLRRAISQGDLTTLQRIPGIGKKSAQRLALEIGDKLGLPAALPSSTEDDKHQGDMPAIPGAVEAEVRAALISLGWTEAVADKALATLGGQGLGASDLLRAALVSLGGQRGR